MIRFLRELWRRFRKTWASRIDQGQPSPDRGLETGTAEEKPILLFPEENVVKVQVGIDFGTSATKVAYRIYGKRGIRVVNFDHNLPHFPNYCLPSLGAIDKRGTLLLGAKAGQYLGTEEWDSGFQRFKVLIAGNCDDRFKDPLTEEKFYAYRDKCGLDQAFKPEQLTSIFLAYVMNLTTEDLKRVLSPGDSKLDLDFNICMPIDHIENTQVSDKFERVFFGAETIYRAWQAQGEGFDPMQAYEKWQVGALPLYDERRVFAIPESVAEIASYLDSLRRKEGLHAVVDIGSGTTDISIFKLNLPPSGESKCFWYAAKNIPKGTNTIERILSNYLKARQIQDVCSNIKMLDYLKDLTVLCSKSECRELSQLIRQGLMETLSSVEYQKVWYAAYRHLLSQTAWEKVEIFISGGGCRLPFVKEILAKPWWENIQARYQVNLIPATEDYNEAADIIPFERIAVAYGLTVPKPKLEEYVLPSDAPDHTPPPLPVRALDRDELYPK